MEWRRGNSILRRDATLTTSCPTYSKMTAAQDFLRYRCTSNDVLPDCTWGCVSARSVYRLSVRGAPKQEFFLNIFSILFCKLVFFFLVNDFLAQSKVSTVWKEQSRHLGLLAFSAQSRCFNMTVTPAVWAFSLGELETHRRVLGPTWQCSRTFLLWQGICKLVVCAPCGFTCDL